MGFSETESTFLDDGILTLDHGVHFLLVSTKDASLLSYFTNPSITALFRCCIDSISILRRVHSEPILNDNSSNTQLSFGSVVSGTSTLGFSCVGSLASCGTHGVSVSVPSFRCSPSCGDATFSGDCSGFIEKQCRHLPLLIICICVV